MANQAPKKLPVKTNGWINLGKIVDVRKRETDDPNAPTRQALALDKNLTMIVRQKNFVNGEEVIVEREFSGGKYFYITPAEDSVRLKYRNNSDMLKKNLEFLNRNPFIRADVSVPPDKENVNYDTQDSAESDDLSELDGK